MNENTKEDIRKPLSKAEQIVMKFRAAHPKLCEAFSTVELEQLALFARKSLDYGTDNIAGGTKLDTAESVYFALNGIWYRMMDKMNRWKHCVMNSYNSLENESLADTFQDLANYAMIASLVLRGEWHDE